MALASDDYIVQLEDATTGVHQETLRYNTVLGVNYSDLAILLTLFVLIYLIETGFLWTCPDYPISVYSFRATIAI